MPEPIIVYDLDGTLVDTAPNLMSSLNAVVAKRGLMPVTRDDLSHLVGHGGRAMLAKVYEKNRRAPDDAEVDAIIAEFLEDYARDMPGQSHPFPGAVGSIERFRAAGWRVAICTNKTERLAVRLITSLGLAHLFEAICGADTFAVRKPDPGHLTATIAQAGGDPARAVMIGDSETDIRTAKAAGIPVVAVDFGYTHAPVATFAPEKVISHFDELTPSLVDALHHAMAAGQRSD